jgi:hypothetical protein
MKKYKVEKAVYDAFCKKNCRIPAIKKTQTTRGAIQCIEQATIDNFHTKCAQSNPRIASPRQTT